jgi:CsoR family transcriptional regulator, copper-sensing transcriptional repressor
MNRSNISRSSTVPLGGPELDPLIPTQLASNPAMTEEPVALNSDPSQTVALVPEVQHDRPEHSDSDHSHGHQSHGHQSHGDQSDLADPGKDRHSHVHDPESIRRIVNRLSRIEGHVRGLKRMVQEQENCPDVLIQVAAVRGALDKVARLILDEHLTQCVVRAAEQGNIQDEIEELQAALNRFLP